MKLKYNIILFLVLNSYHQILGYTITSDSALTYSYTSINDSIKTEKIDFKFTTNGHIKEEIKYKWNDEYNNWNEFNKNAYTYDLNGNILSKSYYSWNTLANNWSGHTKYEYTYDNNFNLTHEIEYYYEDGDSNWVEEYKHENVYSSGLLIVNNSYVMYDDWVITNSITYNYNSDSVRTEATARIWDEIGGQLLDTYKYLYFVNLQKLDTLVLKCKWDKDINDWVNKTKTTRRYNSNNELLLEIIYEWDKDSTDWIYHGKWEYVYDNIGNRSSLSIYYWNTQFNDWLGYRKYDYYHDNQNNIAADVRSKWDSDSGYWYYYSKTFFSTYMTQIEINKSNFLEPINIDYVNDYIKITFPFSSRHSESNSDFSITNLSGANVLNGKLERYINIIDISRIDHGVYFFVISKNTNSYVYKLIKL